MQTGKNSRASLKGTVSESRRIAENHVLLSIAADDVFESAVPGQFVMIRAQNRGFPFLGRPISIYGLRRTKRNVAIELLIRVVGAGTSVLADLTEGDRVYLIGPLGNGYAFFPDKKNIIIVAGGIGIAPLAFLADAYSRAGAQRVLCYFGARSKDQLIGLERLKRTCSKVLLSTEDGSTGHFGMITDLFESDVKKFDREETAVYVCGPESMLAKMQSIVKKYPVPCQVSVEERMACGLGACLGCAVRMKNGGYRRACKEGPVFDIDDVDFEFRG